MASRKGIRVCFDPIGEIWRDNSQDTCTNAQLTPMMNVGNVCI